MSRTLRSKPCNHYKWNYIRLSDVFDTDSYTQQKVALSLLTYQIMKTVHVCMHVLCKNMYGCRTRNTVAWNEFLIQYIENGASTWRYVV